MSAPATYEDSIPPPGPFEVSPVDNRISGRLALITGASGGIGRASAQELASHGCHLALTFAFHREPAEELMNELKGTYPDQTFSIHQADLTTSAFVQPLMNSIKEAHPNMPVLILVSNAGHGVRVRHIEDVTEEEYDLTQAVNTKATYLILKELIPQMKLAYFGRIILISSVSQWGAGVNGLHYAASKGALTAMGRNLSTVLLPFVSILSLPVLVIFRCG